MGNPSSDTSTYSTSRLAGAVLGCLLLTALLVSGKAVEIAERLPLGDSRDQWLAAAESIDRVSNLLALNRPYDFVTSARGAGTDPGERLDSIEAIANVVGLARVQAASAAGPSLPPPLHPPSTQAPTANPKPSAAPASTANPEPPAAPASTANPEPPAAPASTANPEPPPAPLPKIRTVTADDPLRVYVAGDSQAFYPGHALAKEAGRLFDVTVDSRHSTGLARPDYFNWPAELHEAAAGDSFELVVLFLGANDWQAMQSPEGARLSRGSEEWRFEWAWRVEVALEALFAPHRHIVWVGQPPARPESFHAGFSLMNETARQVTLNRPDVTMLDIWEMFGGDGPYRERLAPPAGGSSTKVRQDDGVHLNRTGSAWVAEEIFGIAAQRWHLPAE